MELLTSLKSRYRYSIILLRQLVITDFKLRYQGSVLGYAWSLVRPLALFTILLIVFGFLLKIGSNIPHYSIYLLLGIVLWTFFVEATSSGLQSIVSRGGIIRKLNFPRYVIVVSGSLSALINLCISLVVVMIFMLFQGVGLRPVALFFPLLVLEMYIFALALSFFLAALYVKFRDITYMWELVIQAAFYATPILYPLSTVVKRSPIIAKIMMLNPMAQIIQDARSVLVSPETVTIRSLIHNPFIVLIPIAITVVVAVFAGLYFRKSSKFFAEEV